MRNGVSPGYEYGGYLAGMDRRPFAIEEATSIPDMQE
jgi:hypothetical protein